MYHQVVGLLDFEGTDTGFLIWKYYDQCHCQPFELRFLTANSKSKKTSTKSTRIIVILIAPQTQNDFDKPTLIWIQDHGNGLVDRIW